MRLIIASSNQKKLNEIDEILKDFPIRVMDKGQLGISEDPEETGKTFKENAIIKMQALAQKFPNDFVIADDSGLCIDALNGDPGIYSSRWGGDLDYNAKMDKILDLLKDVPEKDRTARFVCAVAIHYPNGEMECVQAELEGIIANEKSGSHGFGYDPIFYVHQFGKTTAELLPEEKHDISHRGQALKKMKKQIKKWLNNPHSEGGLEK